MPNIERIVNQYADDAAFLWMLRDQYVTAPNLTLRELAKHDERINAHLDGLRIAGDSGWQFLEKALETGEAGEVFVASVLAYECGREDRIQQVVAAGTASVEASRGLISAIGWLPYELVERHIRALNESEDVHAIRISISANAIHRRITLPTLINGVGHAEPLIRARSLRAIGEIGKIELLPDLRKNLNDPDENCRYWSAWSSALLGDASGIDVLANFVRSECGFEQNALNVLLRVLTLPAANALLDRMAGSPPFARKAVIGAGIIGDPGNVPWLLEQMKTTELARIAADAFSMIAGVDLTDQNLGSDRPDNFESGPTDNPEDDNIAMDPDEQLPWPDCARISNWWFRNRDRFTVGTRYLLGRPLADETWLEQVLGIGFQRQRAAAALELAIRRPGQQLFNVKAPGFRQQFLLGIDQNLR